MVYDPPPPLKGTFGLPKFLIFFISIPTTYGLLFTRITARKKIPQFSGLSLALEKV
jgi:hypothetical protein